MNLESSVPTVAGVPGDATGDGLRPPSYHCVAVGTEVSEKKRIQLERGRAWKLKNQEKIRNCRIKYLPIRRIRERENAAHIRDVKRKWRLRVKGTKTKVFKVVLSNVERCRRYHETHQLQDQKRKREYAQKHPEKLKAWDLNKKARRRNADTGDSKAIERWILSWKNKTKITCFWCLKRFSPDQCHVDHIVALSLGGKHSIENLCVSCASCNMSKGAKPLWLWKANIQQPSLCL